MTDTDWNKTKMSVIVLTAEDFEDFMRVMNSATKPTPSIMRGSELLRTLYAKAPTT